MQMNFFIALRASRAALTAMIEQGTRAIVKVASVNAFFQRDAPRSTTAPPRRTGQPHRDAVPGIRPMRYPCQRSLARPLSTPTYASASAPSLRRWPRPPASTLTPRKTIIAGIGGFATSRLIHPGGGRHIDHVPGLRPDSQDHRRQLPHRRWPDQSNLRPGHAFTRVCS
jgi:hypothetical protein